MNPISLLSPMLDQGIRNPNFFNGRLLTAQDLKDFQTANRDQHGLLGKAVGDGVVSGLMVSLDATTGNGAAPTVSLTAGLAVNRRGRALWLPEPVQVQLAKNDTTTAPDPAGFSDCGTGAITTFTGGVTGASILVITPASGMLDQAPVRAGADCGCVTGCGDKYAVEGVKFCLVPLTLPTDFPTNEKLLRNNIAHYCFGTATLVAAASDPMHAPAKYGAIDTLHDQGALTDCDVPLALVYWTAAGVQFVDNWAVRRRASWRLGEGIDNPWPMHAPHRRLAEAEAMLFQFQEQLSDVLAADPNPSKLAATKYFHYLPPGGYLPMPVESFEFNPFDGINRLFRESRVRIAFSRGFDPGAFFGPLFLEESPLDTAFVRNLIERSLHLEPIDTTTQSPIVRIYKTGLAGQLIFLRQEPRPPADPKPARIEVVLNFGSGRIGSGTSAVSIMMNTQVSATIQTVGQPIPGHVLILPNRTFEIHVGRFDRYTVSIPLLNIADVIFYTATYVVDSIPANTYKVEAVTTTDPELHGFDTSNPPLTSINAMVVAGGSAQVTLDMRIPPPPPIQ